MVDERHSISVRYLNTMKAGMTLQLLSDNEDPGRSPNTDLVMAWHTLGGTLANPCIQRVVENDKPYCTWFIDDSVAIDINGDKIGWAEFKRRWEDIEWCKANEWHPISVIRAFRDNARDGKRQAREQAVGIRIRKGNTEVVCYPDSPEWLKREFAKFL